MKKLLAVLLSVVILALFCSCGDTPPPENMGVYYADIGLFSVKVTVKPGVFEGMTEDEIKSQAKESGYLGCTIHSDGSVTYFMTKARHKEFLQDARSNIRAVMDNLLEGGEIKTSFTSIEHTDDFSQIDVYVNAKEYNALEYVYSVTFFGAGTQYQGLSGMTSDEFDIVVNFIDNKTGELIDYNSYQEYSQALESE